MNRENKKRTRRRQILLRLYTHDEAMKALPYIGSIVASIRENRLEALHQDREAQKLANQFGRPTRATLIAQTEAIRHAEAANERFLEAVEELQALDIYCLDPVRGEALIPTAHANQLAWFVYDLFDKEPLKFWRYHQESYETRRPLAEMEGPAPATAA